MDDSKNNNSITEDFSVLENFGNAISSLKQKIEAQDKNLTSIKAENKSLKNKNQALNKEVSKSEFKDEISRLTIIIQGYESTIATMKSTLTEQRRDKASLDSQLDSLTQSIAFHTSEETMQKTSEVNKAYFWRNTIVAFVAGFVTNIFAGSIWNWLTSFWNSAT